MAGQPPNSFPSTNTSSGHLVEDLESAFQTVSQMIFPVTSAELPCKWLFQTTCRHREMLQKHTDCIKTLTAQEYFNASDSDEVKSSVEQNLQKFLDLARQTEAVFLQKRLLVSLKKPEQVVKEDIQELRQELIRKETMLVKHQDKLQQWQNLMRSIQSGQPVPNQATTGVSHPNPPSQGMPTNIMGPGQHSQQGQPPASQSMMIGGQSHTYSGGPGPLAYLEQTMSNIGMPERR